LRDTPHYSIIGAGSGKEALERANESIDLILLDVQLPDVSGFEVLSRLREKLDVPVVFMSSDNSAETINRAVNAGVTDYVTKPFRPIILKEIVHGILDA
ncbi:MAG: response regulator, partial [Oscillospiraceae bacterium]